MGWLIKKIIRDRLAEISVLILFLTGSLWLGFRLAQGAGDSTFTQSDWSGGGDAGASATQTLWTKYSSITSGIDATSTAGQISLSNNPASFSDNTDTNFAAGTKVVNDTTDADFGDVGNGNYESMVSNSSGVTALTKFLEVSNNSLSRLTNVTGRFSYANATCMASIGIRLVSDWIWLARRMVISLGISTFNSELILAISVSINVVAIFLSLLRNERNSIMLIILVAPLTFLLWTASRILSTAGHKGLAVRDSFSWVSQLIKTSVSSKMRLLDSAIIGVSHTPDNPDAAFAFFQYVFKFTRQRFNYVARLSFLNSVQVWLERFYCFLKSWTHSIYLLFIKHIINSYKSQARNRMQNRVICARESSSLAIESLGGYVVYFEWKEKYQKEIAS